MSERRLTWIPIVLAAAFAITAVYLAVINEWATATIFVALTTYSLWRRHPA